LAAGRNSDTASRQALEVLCARYWPALYGYVRRRGHSADDAADLTQEFFLRLLEHNWVARADQSRGRFRSFILTVLKRFLADEWDKVKSLKRGGAIQFVSLSESAESVYSLNTTATAEPELEFERDWAMTLLSNVLAALEQEYTAGGKQQLFVTLRNYLVGGTDERPYAAAAAELGMTEGAFKVAVHRIRQRYREKMKEEVAATVANPSDIEPELRHLYRILAKSR
jgi:RNA polymerase sigma-70 factor (ECF subfamily)